MILVWQKCNKWYATLSLNEEHNCVNVTLWTYTAYFRICLYPMLHMLHSIYMVIMDSIIAHLTLIDNTTRAGPLYARSEFITRGVERNSDSNLEKKSSTWAFSPLDRPKWWYFLPIHMLHWHVTLTSIVWSMLHVTQF